MKVFTVHLKQNDPKPLETVVLVPEAFSWIALIFPLNIISAITHKNWALLMILVIYFFTALAQFNIPSIDHIIAAMKLGLFVFLGVWANDLLRLSLKHRGFDMVGVVSGEDESDAQLRFFEETAPLSS